MSSHIADLIKAPVRRARAHTVRFYKDKKGEWRWQALRSGRIVADSGEGYARLSACRKAFFGLIETPALVVKEDK